MTRVMCGFIMCKYNKSCKPAAPGLCLKDEVNLRFGITEDEELEYLTCKEFDWDNDKKLVRE
jgi:hypothetical protein